MIGAGGQAGQGDAANLLKPALARGELRTVAATTWSEYKKYFEKDPALSRRFQVVKVEEPDERKCSVMMRGVVPFLEKHHNVRILDEGLESAVRLSHRYLPDRQLPDKAVSVLDTACARLALGQNVTPAAIEDCTRTLDDIAVQTRVLEREAAVGADHAERLASLATMKESTDKRLADSECALGTGRQAGFAHPRDPHAAGSRRASEEGGWRGRGRAAACAGPPGAARRIGQTEHRTGRVAGRFAADARLAWIRNLIGEVISGWTGIPVGKMLSDEVQTVLKLEQHLGSRVIGQDHALGVIIHAHADVEGGHRGSRTSRWACSCWRDRRASARPKPRWR